MENESEKKNNNLEEESLPKNDEGNKSEEITIEQLIKETGKFFKYSGEYKEAPTFPGSTARRCPDIGKAVKDLGYKPLYSWKESLYMTLEWYKEFFESGSDTFETSFEKPDV